MNKPFQSPFIPVGPPRLLIPDHSSRSVLGSMAVVGILAVLVFAMMMLFNHQIADVGVP